MDTGSASARICGGERAALDRDDIGLREALYRRPPPGAAQEHRFVVRAQACDHREADLLAAARVAVAGGEQGAGDAVGLLAGLVKASTSAVPGDCAHGR